MPGPHRPDLDGPAAWRSQSDNPYETPELKLRLPWPITTTDRNNILWPGFNLTDLSMRHETMLELLHTRCENQPRKFAVATDLGSPENASLEESLGFTSRKAPRYVKGMGIVDVAFRGTPETYGLVKTVDNRGEMNDLLGLGLCTEPQAERIMKVQATIYRFLGDFCQEISKNQAYAALDADFPPFDDGLGSMVPKYDMGLNEVDNKEKFEDFLQTHYDLIPYSKPYTIDWEYLEALADRQLRRAEKRLKDMKESPLAFMKELEQARKHSIDQLRVTPGGRRMAWWKKDDLTVAGWAQHLGTVLKDLMDSYDTWHRVYTLIVKNTQSAKLCDGQQSELMEESVSYRDNYHRLVIMAQLYEDRRRTLIQIMRSSPGLRDMFALDLAAKKVTYVRQPRSNTLLNFVAAMDALENSNSRNALGVWTIVAEVNEMVHDNVLRHYITGYVRWYVEDLHAMGSIARALQTLERVYPGTLPTNAKRKNLDFARPISRLIKLSTAAENRAMATGPLGDTVLGRLCEGTLETPLDEFLAYGAIGQRAQPALLKSMKQSEDRLAAFWAALEETLRAESAISQEVQDVLNNVNPLETYIQIGDTPLTPPIALEYNRPSRLVSSMSRRNDALARNVEIPMPPPAQRRGQRPRIELGQRVYDTLRLVMGPVTGALPASIPWSSILRLMDEIGFDHEKAIGTARRFVPRERLVQIQGVETSLCRHVPQDGRLDTNIARNWLNDRAYGFASFGWTFESFQLKRPAAAERQNLQKDDRSRRRTARTVISRRKR